MAEEKRKEAEHKSAMKPHEKLYKESAFQTLSYPPNWVENIILEVNQSRFAVDQWEQFTDTPHR